MKFKVCGLKYHENISHVLECKPDYIGFIFYKKSLRYAGDELAIEFAQRIPSAKKVGVFVNETEINILDIVSRYGLDLVQLHGDESPQFCVQIRKCVPVIKAFQIDEIFDFSNLNSYTNACDYFLFDSKSNQYGGSGAVFNWNKLSEYKLSKPFFLSGGINIKNINEVSNLKSQISCLYAIDINSRFETEPGIKDIEKIKLLKSKLHDEL